jgi:hypothetical protein
MSGGPVLQIISQDSVVELADGVVEIVTVGEQGPSGPRGIQGIKGETGDVTPAAQSAAIEARSAADDARANADKAAELTMTMANNLIATQAMLAEILSNS